MSDYVFFGNQDLGALGYDRWKEERDDPYSDHEYEREVCEHEEYDVEDDFAYCRCGASWRLSAREIVLWHEHMRRAQDAWEHELRREKLRAFFAPLREFWGRWFVRRRPDDDEIPF